MFVNLMILLFISFATASVHARDNSIHVRIIGGKDADIKDHPYIVSLVTDGTHFCAASLIHPKWALTCAHCMELLKPEDVIVSANSTYLDQGVNITVKNIFSHPSFRHVTSDSDIALIELSSPLNCTYCRTIPLSKTVPESGQNCTITGWGTRQTNGSDTWPTLQEATIPVVDFNECQENYVNSLLPLTHNMFCAGFINEGGVDSCVGDSGGPVVINGTLAGLISWAHNCAEPGFPGVNTVVSHFLSWIRDISGVEG